MGADMKIIVFSDSHREIGHMRDVINRERPDYVFHLGDHDTDAELISREFQLLPVAMVRGNCDGWSDTPKTLTLNIGGVTFFLCHGHTLGVKTSYMRAIFAAREQGADVLLFGHTHIPERDESNGLKLLNPGACGYGYDPTYGYFIIENGAITDWGIRKCKG